MSTWVDVTCGKCGLWLGDARNAEGRMALAVAHFEAMHPEPHDSEAETA
jgi:hypothetical protein